MFSKSYFFFQDCENLWLCEKELTHDKILQIISQTNMQMRQRKQDMLLR